MELGELCKKTLDIFECDNISDLGGKLYDAVINNDIVKLTAFCNTVNYPPSKASGIAVAIFSSVTIKNSCLTYSYIFLEYGKIR